MTRVTTRKQGGSVIATIPPELGIKDKEDIEFVFNETIDEWVIRRWVQKRGD